MTITDVRKDPQAATLTVTTEWDTPIERMWELWSNPRMLEQWWGPPTYPAKVGTHEFVPGGTVTYTMTGPEGDEHKGFWSVVSVESPRSFIADDGFANADGTLNEQLPITRFTVTLEERDSRTHMIIESRFKSSQHLEEVLAMGMEEGFTAALGQIDALLAKG